MVEQVIQPFSKDCNILVDEVRSIEIALLDNEDQGQIFLHNPQSNDLIFFFIVEFDISLALTILMPIFIIEVRNINKDIQDIWANIVFVLIGKFLVIMSDVEFSDKVEEVYLFYFGVGGKVIEKFTDIGWARYHFLNDLAKSLEYGWIIDGGKEELYFFYIDLILTDSFLQFYLILIPCVGLI